MGSEMCIRDSSNSRLRLIRMLMAFFKKNYDGVTIIITDVVVA